MSRFTEHIKNFIDSACEQESDCYYYRLKDTGFFDSHESTFEDRQAYNAQFMLTILEEEWAWGSYWLDEITGLLQHEESNPDNRECEQNRIRLLNKNNYKSHEKYFSDELYCCDKSEYFIEGTLYPHPENE